MCCGIYMVGIVGVVCRLAWFDVLWTVVVRGVGGVCCFPLLCLCCVCCVVFAFV